MVPTSFAKDKRRKIYIAGPISTGDQLANINAAMKVWSALLKAGFIPFCPHWSAIQHMHNPELSHSDWMDYDLPWVEACDAVLRMPGPSAGADIETDHAERLGITTFYYGIEISLTEIIQIMQRRMAI